MSPQPPDLLRDRSPPRRQVPAPHGAQQLVARHDPARPLDQHPEQGGILAGQGQGPMAQGRSSGYEVDRDIAGGDHRPAEGVPPPQHRAQPGHQFPLTLGGDDVLRRPVVQGADDVVQPAVADHDHRGAHQTPAVGIGTGGGEQGLDHDHIGLKPGHRLEIYDVDRCGHREPVLAQARGHGVGDPGIVSHQQHGRMGIQCRVPPYRRRQRGHAPLSPVTRIRWPLPPISDPVDQCRTWL